MYIKSMFPHVAAPEIINLYDLLLRRPDQANWPDYTLYIEATTDRKQTYRGFVERVLDGATVLGTSVSHGGLGLRPDDGEVVGILSENCMDYVALIHSLLAITVPFSLLSSYYTPFELEHALRLSQTTRLFVHPNLLPMAFSVASKVGLSERNIYILEGHASGRDSFGDMVDRVRVNHIPRLPPRPATKDTLAYLLFSSGTSGLPKAVKISHGNIFVSFLQAIVVLEEVAKVFTPPPCEAPEGIDISLGFLPFHHAYGLHAFSLRLFLTPSTVVILPKWNIENAIKAIAKYKITRALMIPSAIHQLVNYPKLNKEDLSSLRFLGSGAAYLPPKLAEALFRIAPKDVFFTQGYGMTETTIAVTASGLPGMLGGRPKFHPESIGILLPGMDARILREDGSETDVNEPGELWVKGGNIALGYLNNEKANRETFVDGWLRTGDRVRVDEHGSIFFEDRTKDTMKISGMQVSPTEIEDALLAQPDKLIIDVAVAGVPGGRTSDEKIPRAWIVLSDVGQKLGSDAVVKALEAWYKQCLSQYKWLHGGIEIVNEIPRSPTGKLLRRVLQDNYEAQSKQLRTKL